MYIFASPTISEQMPVCGTSVSSAQTRAYVMVCRERSGQQIGFRPSEDNKGSRGVVKAVCQLHSRRPAEAALAFAAASPPQQPLIAFKCLVS